MSNPYKTILYRREFEKVRDKHEPGDSNPAYKYEELLFSRINSKIVDNDSEQAVLAALTPGQRMHFSLCVFIGQVNNGGVSQFFFNSGSLGFEVLNSLLLLRQMELATRYSAVLAKAGGNAESLQKIRSAFNTNPPNWDHFIEYTKVLGETEPGSEFNSYFFKHSLELENAIIAYIESHPDEFMLFCDDDPELQIEYGRRNAAGTAEGIILMAEPSFFEDVYVKYFHPPLQNEWGAGDPAVDDDTRANALREKIQPFLEPLAAICKGEVKLNPARGKDGELHFVADGPRARFIFSPHEDSLALARAEWKNAK